MKTFLLLLALSCSFGNLFAGELETLEKLMLGDCRSVVAGATSRPEVIAELQAQLEAAAKNLEASRQRAAFRKANLERAKLYDSVPPLVRESLNRQGLRFTEDDFSAASNRFCAGLSSYYVAHSRSVRMAALWEERLHLCERNLERATGRREALSPPPFAVYRPRTKPGEDWMSFWNDFRGMVKDLERNGKILIRLASPFREDLIRSTGTDRQVNEIGWSGVERDKDEEVIRALSAEALPIGIHLSSPDQWPPQGAPGWFDDFLQGEVMIVLYRADGFNPTSVPRFYQFRHAFRKRESVVGIIRSPTDPFDSF